MGWYKHSLWALLLLFLAVPSVPTKRQKLDLQKARKRGGGAGDADLEDAQYSRYRHLYQVRRVNGDVIAQVNNITLKHNKLFTAAT